MSFVTRLQTHWFLRMAVATVFCIYQCACTGTTAMRPDDRVANLLIRDFESVFFADASLFRGDIFAGRLPRQHSRGLQAPFGQMRKALEQSELVGLSRELFAAKVAESVAVGARDFRAPAGLGPVLSEKCYVIRLTTNHLDLKKLLSMQPVAELKGKPVWSLAFRYGGEKTTSLASIFMVQPEPEYIVMATSLVLARNVASELSRESTMLEASHRLNEWPDVASSPIWGYREYRTASGGDTVASGTRIGNVKIPPNARGLLFFVKVKDAGQLQYITSDPDDQTAVQLNRELGFSFGRTGARVWQTSIPLSEDEHSGELIFGLFVMFGFGAFL